MFNPGDAELKELLSTARTIAIVGAKDKEGQPVDRIGRYLMKAGYTVIPVHPVRKDVWGLETYQSLGDVPQAMDIVNLFRASQYCAAHAEEVLALTNTPRCFWMQSGITNVEAANMLAPKNIQVVQDACIMVEHARLLG